MQPPTQTLPNHKAAPSSALPSTIGGRYRIERLLGRGGCGKVFLAQHQNTGERVALKLLTGGTRQQEFVERFKREMRVPAQLRSEHVVRVLDADVSPELNGAPFFVMERLVGSDLQKFLGRHGALTREETVWILGQVGRALQRAHQIGLVHRDLKPENLFLHLRPDAPPIIKILDFGLVHLMRSPEAAPTQPDSDTSGRFNIEHIGDARMTRAGTIIGTPMYMAPELVEGAVDRTGPATDIWALGLIAFELLTGISFWIPAPVPLLLGRILDGPMPSPTSRSKKVPAGFVPWFMRSCARDANGRWQTVNEQLEALAKALEMPVGLLNQADPPASLLKRVEELLASLSGAEMVVADLPSRPPPPREPTLTKTAVIARRLRQLSKERRMNFLLAVATLIAVLLWAVVFSLRACQSEPPQLPAVTPPADLSHVEPPPFQPTPAPVLPEVQHPVGAEPPEPEPEPEPTLPERKRRPRPSSSGSDGEPAKPLIKKPKGPYMPIAP